MKRNSERLMVKDMTKVVITDSVNGDYWKVEQQDILRNSWFKSYKITNIVCFNLIQQFHVIQINIICQ